MKKKVFTLVPFIIVMVSGLFLFIQNCTVEPKDSGKLQITIESNMDAKTLLPGISMDIATYDLYGTGPLGKSFEVLSFPNTTITFESLAFGDWVIRIDGKNSAGDLIGTGTQTVRVNTNETTTVNISVTPVTGSGTLNLTVNWDGTATYLPSIDAQLVSTNNTVIPLTFTVANGNTASYNGLVANGYYTLVVKLLDNTLLAYGTVEIVRIAANAVTTGVFNFLVNPPGGAIDVNITPEMNDPITVNLAGTFTTMASTESKTITASVDASVGAVTYVWYLNGVAKNTGSTYNINNLVSGFYSLDVTAITVDGKRAGSSGFEFTVTGNEVYGPALNLNQGGNNIPYNGSFDFDTIPVANRDQPVTFTIYNAGSVTLVLTGSPLIQIKGTDASAFAVTAYPASSSIPPKTSQTFKIQLTATELDGLLKSASVEIPNSVHTINPFIFGITCTNKIQETHVYSTTTDKSWTCPVTGTLVASSVYGGSGGAGGGAGGYYLESSNPYVADVRVAGSGGGGGGGTAKVTGTLSLTKGTVYRLVVGAAGLPGANGVGGGNGSNGGNGGSSGIQLNSSWVIVSAGGGGGKGGICSSTFTTADGGSGTSSGSDSKNDPADPDGGLGGNSTCAGTVGDGNPNGVGTSGGNATCRGGGGSGGGGGGSVEVSVLVGYDPYGNPIYENEWQTRAGGDGGAGYVGILTFTTTGFTK